MTISRRLSWDGKPLAANSGEADDPDAADAPAEADAFDPSEHTVDEVLAHVEEHPDDRDKVVAAEQSGKGRVTLLGALAPPEADDED